MLVAALAILSVLSVQSSAEVTRVRLNDGSMMPVMSFGSQSQWDTDVCKNATALALQAGFRMIWSSELSGDDCQRAQGEAAKESGISRSELFIAGTAQSGSCAGYSDCYQMTSSLAAKQIKLLGFDPLDMMMLHFPSYGCESIQGQWDALEDLKKAGKVHSIAVSNFKTEQLDCIRKPSSATNRSFPAVNQMQYCVGHGGDPIVSYDAPYGITVQAWSPLNLGTLPHDKTCAGIGKVHNKTAAQVALRWVYQHNATINTQSTNFQHMKEDLDIFDFELSGSEMKRLDLVPMPPPVDLEMTSQFV